MALLTTTLLAVISILFGVIIIFKPKLLSYLVGIYLILVGILQLIGLSLGLSPLV